MPRPQILIQVSIPPRLRGEMMFKEAFEVRNTKDGRDFVQWLETSSTDARDSIMKTAYERDINIVDALREKMESECEQ
jgi:hypothetical protein